MSTFYSPFLSHLPLKRVFFWGGLALAVWIGQQTGVLGSKESFAVQGATEDNNVVIVATEDEAMTQAQASAQKTLPKFLIVAQTAPADWQASTLKVALQGGTQIENIWVSNFKALSERSFEAVLGNDPVDLPGLQAGDRVTFNYEQIVDWAFVKEGKGYGFYSVRAILPMMEGQQREGMVAFLSTQPEPPIW